MECSIEFGVWAALIGAGAWLAWPREAEPRWVRIVERGFPVRGRWARRLIAVPFLVGSLFPCVYTSTSLPAHTFIEAGYFHRSAGCWDPVPVAPQGLSYYCGSGRGRGVQAWTLRIGNWVGRVVRFADVDTT